MLTTEDNLLALDTETTGIDLRHGCRPFFVSIANGRGECQYWQWRVHPVTRQPEIPQWEKEEIVREIQGKDLVFHNASFDILALETIGIRICCESLRINEDLSRRTSKTIAHVGRVEDTLLASHVTRSIGSHDLKDLAVLPPLEIGKGDERKLKKATHIARRWASKHGWTKGKKLNGDEAVYSDYWMIRQATEAGADIPQGETLLRDYGCLDPVRTMGLWKIYCGILARENLFRIYLRELRLLPYVMRMEASGITIDLRRLRRARAQLTHHQDQAATLVGNYSQEKEFNIRSPKQVREILFGRLGLKPRMRTDKKGDPSTSAKHYEKLLPAAGKTGYSIAVKVLNALIDHTSCASLDRYLAGYEHAAKGLLSQRNGQLRRLPCWAILYPSFNQVGTGTTRFTSSNPNGQNIPKRTGDVQPGEYRKPIKLPNIRSIFGPSPGKVWYAADYSQLELRIFAVVAKEQSLIDAFARGEDIHGYVASRIFGKDPLEITTEERRVAKNTNFSLIYGGGETKVDATAGMPGAYQLFKKQFPRAAGYMQEIIEIVRKQGYVETLYGYRLYVNPETPYAGVDYVVQGTAGDIAKNAMLSVSRSLDWEKERIILQVHDELVFEFDEDTDHEKKILWCADEMERAGKALGVTTPVEVDLIEKDWASGKEIQRKKETLC